MAYNGFQKDKPDGAVDNGTSVPANANRNDKALRDAIIGLVFGTFEFSITAGTGDARRPQYMFWKDGSGGSATWIRATITWGTSAGAKYNPTSIAWEYSANGGTSYDNMLAGAQALTWDASGNLTAVTNGASGLLMVTGLLGHVHRLRDDYDTHAAATGTAVHGLGSMSTQSASNVAITGGYAELTRIREGKSAVGSISGSTAIDWSAAGLFTITVTGASAALTWSNLPSAKAGYITLEVVNGGLATALLPAGTKTVVGTPSWSSSGTNIAVLMCHDGSEVTLVGFGLKATI